MMENDVYIWMQLLGGQLQSLLVLYLGAKCVATASRLMSGSNLQLYSIHIATKILTPKLPTQPEPRRGQ